MKVTKLFKQGEEDTKSANHRFYDYFGNTLVYLPIKDCCLYIYIYKDLSWSKNNLPLLYCTQQTLWRMFIAKLENI